MEYVTDNLQNLKKMLLHIPHFNNINFNGIIKWRKKYLGNLKYFYSNIFEPLKFVQRKESKAYFFLRKKNKIYFK